MIYLIAVFYTLDARCVSLLNGRVDWSITYNNTRQQEYAKLFGIDYRVYHCDDIYHYIYSIYKLNDLQANRCQYRTSNSNWKYFFYRRILIDAQCFRLIFLRTFVSQNMQSFFVIFVNLLNKQIGRSCFKRNIMLMLLQLTILFIYIFLQFCCSMSMLNSIYMCVHVRPSMHSTSTNWNWLSILPCNCRLTNDFLLPTEILFPSTYLVLI